MNLDDAQQTFIVESLELLQQMEDALLHIELAPDDDDTINAIFRAAHTIKGSAGLFGLDDIVAFTHVAESVLDRVRDKHLHFDEQLTALFLRVCDHIGVLVKLVCDNERASESVLSNGASLLDRLRHLMGEEPGVAQDSYAKQQGSSVEIERSAPGDVSQAQHWHISLRLGRDLLRNGMDPLAFIRYLATLGHICNIVTLSDDLPTGAGMDPESCYLGFEIGFHSHADQATIEGVFEFIREDSQVHILAPRTKTDEYRKMIQALPPESLRMGEIFLIRCGIPEAEPADATHDPISELPSQPSIAQDVVHDSVEQPIIEMPTEEEARNKRSAKDARKAENSLIRVDAGKLDQLINLIGELIIAGAGANLAARNTGASELVEATAVVARLVEEVRDSALTLRMVQIGSTFNRFQRVVRDVAKELGKDILLEINGGETELDKTVVERIADPLTHLVRNAMDHGIEPAEVRLARGKPAQGRLRLNAYHDAGSIIIEVADNGGGLNKQAILRKAIERGLVNEGQSLADQDIFNLIFEPGFSTAERVSNLSGRGVGMDVVKRNITALRGSVELDSVEGQGTTLRIRLPLTLAIIDGFLVGVDNANYVIPQDRVVECIELARDQANAGDYLNLRGEVLPFIRLRDLFDIAGTPPRRENVVVVQFSGQRAGLVVDSLLGEFQTVIKPLGKVFGEIDGVGGFTILGSGEVALILDVSGLIKRVIDTRQRAIAAN